MFVEYLVYDFVGEDIFLMMIMLMKGVIRSGMKRRIFIMFLFGKL